MMREFKKSVISMLGISIMLVGCSQAAQDTLENENQVSEAQSNTDKVQIEYWYGLGSIAGETMQEIIDDFNESQDEIYVTGVQQGSYEETYESVVAAMAADNAPAVYIGSANKAQAEEGMYAPLDEIIGETDVNINDYVDVFIEGGNIDGTQYAFPGFGTTQVVYYRSDILEEAGIDPEDMFSTWENVDKYSRQLVDEGYVEFGHLQMWGKDNMADMATSFGGEYISEDGNQALLDSQEWLDSWTLYVRALEDGITKVESGGQGWDYWYRTIDEVMNGNAISYMGSSGDKGDLDFNIIGSHIQPGGGGHEPNPTAGSNDFLIPSSVPEEEQAAAMEFILYFTSPEVQARWAQVTGYIPVHKETENVTEYADFLEENPEYKVPSQQADIARPNFVDPTNGEINDALSIAADRIQLEGKSAEEALSEAQEKAQEALDSLNE